MFEGLLEDFLLLLLQVVDLAVHRLVQQVLLVHYIQVFQSVPDYFGVGGRQMVLAVFESFRQLAHFVVVNRFQILKWLFYSFAVFHVFERLDLLWEN